MTLTSFVVGVLVVAVFLLIREVRAINRVIERRGNEQPPVVSDPTQLDPRDVAAAAVDRHVQEFHRR